MPLINALPGGGNSPEMASLWMTNFTSAKGYPLADVAPLYTMTGNADTLDTDQQETDAGTRDIGSTWTGVTTSVNTKSASLIIFGAQAMTDSAYNRRGENASTKHMQTWESVARGAGRDFMNRVVNDGPSRTSKKFLGWKYLVDSTMKANFMSANGGQLLSDGTTNAKKAVNALTELLDFMIEKVGDPTCLVMDGLVVSRLESNAKENMRIEKIQDSLGADQRIRFYREIPIKIAGFNKDRTARVLEYNETLGTSTDCTSIYIPRFGEKEDLTMATNLGFVTNSTLVDNVTLKTTSEMDVDVVLQRISALAKIEGVRLG